MNWRALLVVFGAAIAGFIVYDVVVGPMIASSGLTQTSKGTP